MKVLILGGSGMLGHKLWQLLSQRFDTYATFRREPAAYARFGMFREDRSIGGVHAEELDSVVRALHQVRPDVVINCIGIIKQSAEAKDPIRSITINSLFPHRLGELCGAAGARLVHISTDCVFDGTRGCYRESDDATATDLYGRTKHLGEVTADGCLTLRTSIIGRELEGSHGLVEWFLSQDGASIRGFRRAIFSGLTTNALGGVIAEIIEKHSTLGGLWQVASEPISKFDLLTLVKGAYDLDIEITPDDDFHCDRSLDGSRFIEATGITIPSWPAMIAEMYNDSTPYAELRRSYATDR
jgi:dTDP-4-dehydrorhamnose reductase